MNDYPRLPVNFDTYVHDVDDGSVTERADDGTPWVYRLGRPISAITIQHVGVPLAVAKEITAFYLQNRMATVRFYDPYEGAWYVVTIDGMPKRTLFGPGRRTVTVRMTGEEEQEETQ